MTTGENLPLVKVEKLSFMDPKFVKKLYKLFPIIHRFLGDGEDKYQGYIDLIFEAYKVWVKDRPKKLLSYQIVYCYKGELLAMPYPIKGLEKFVLGICVDGVVHLEDFLRMVEKFDFSEDFNGLKERIIKQHGEAIAQFNLRLPTQAEVLAIVRATYTEYSVAGKCMPGEDHQTYWITPPQEFPEMKHLKVDRIQSNEFTLREESSDSAILSLVFHPREDQMYVGKLTTHGVIDKDTQEKLEPILKGLAKKKKANNE